MASRGHIWARLWKWAGCLPSERCRLASWVGINDMIYILLGVGVFVFIFLPFLFSHYLWTLTLLFVLWTSVNGWDQGIWTKRHCRGFRCIYKEPQTLNYFSTTQLVSHLFLIFTECWKLGLWVTGRPDMIKVLERSVTLGQAPERKAEVVALCLFVCFFAELPIGSHQCWFCVWPRNGSLSVQTFQWLPGVMTVIKKSKTFFSVWNMICIFFLIPLFKAEFQAL